MIDPERIWSSPQLPTLPSVAARLLKLVRDPHSSIDQVIEAIRPDPAISAKMIKSANASYFGFRNEIRTLERAVPLLGTTVSTSLALSFILTDDSMKGGEVASLYQQFWKRSIVQAAAAEILARQFPNTDIGEYFLAGLLMGIGELAMLRTIPSETLACHTQSLLQNRPLSEVQQERLGFDYTLIGSRLMEGWKLPATIIQAACHQNASVSELESLATPETELPILTGAAAAAVGEYFLGADKKKALIRMRLLIGRILNNKNVNLKSLIQSCQERIREIAVSFDVDMNDVGSPTDMMSQANEQLLQLTLREHVSKTQAQMSQAALTEEKSRLEEQNRQLKSLTIHDSLTGLHNRKFFDDALQKELSRAQQEASAVAVIFADVDKFKVLNDTYGHAVGDVVLKTIAQRFQQSIRVSDVVARYGGEEFVILVHQPTEKGIEALANRIRQQVAQEPITAGELQLNVTCSLGGCIGIPGRRDPEIGKRLLAAADQAMYRAKREGRNRVIVDSLISEEERRLNHDVTNRRFSRWLVQRGLVDVTSISRALLELPPHEMRLGELAESLGFMSAEAVEHVRELQETSEGRFGEIAIQQGKLTRSQLVHLLAAQRENPKQLTTIIIRLGLMSPDTAVEALHDYTLEHLLLATPPEPAKASVS